MANSISLDAFVRGVKGLWPGATVWTKGDLAHQSSPSDHNNDDTAGSRPEQVDADSIPEVRAADIPLLGGVTMPMLRGLRVKLTTRPENQFRLRYVILEQTIWRKRNGWVAESYNGKYHGHLHASIDAADDDNRDPWGLDDAAAPAPRGVTTNQEDGDMFVFSTDEDNDGNEGLLDDRWAHVSGGVWVEYDDQTLGTALAKSLRQGNNGAPLNAVVLTGAEYAGLRAPYEANGRVLSA